MFEEFVQQPCYICGSVSQTSPQLGQGGTGKSSKHSPPHLNRLTHTLCACTYPHTQERSCLRSSTQRSACACVFLSLNGQHRERRREGREREDGGGDGGGGDIQRCFLALPDKDNGAGLYCLCIYFRETLRSDSAATQRIRFRTFQRHLKSRRQRWAVAVATYPLNKVDQMKPSSRIALFSPACGHDCVFVTTSRDTTMLTPVTRSLRLLFFRVYFKVSYKELIRMNSIRNLIAQ